MVKLANPKALGADNMAEVIVFIGFHKLSYNTCHSLLVDSLPDKSRTPESFSVVERLCHTGARGMGAIKFTPALGATPRRILFYGALSL